jgi:transcriptional regulator with XRE-family HTH domain
VARGCRGEPLSPEAKALRIFEKTATARIGEVLLLRRRQRGLSLRGVARRTGLDMMRLSRMERGLHAPRFATLLVLCRLLRLDIWEIAAEIGFPGVAAPPPRVEAPDAASEAAWLEVAPGALPEPEELARAQERFRAAGG